ncbi:hypothetical protein [Chryseobacterium sp. T20]|uniref:hypothetical protein n=1 Tax=Chryseobacterium sp. T20 TaxID=3395375 RepID=UPI0039BC5AC4
MSDGVGLNNNLVEYVVVNVGLIAKAQNLSSITIILRTQENQRFSARELSFPCRFFLISSA